jgi:DNA gyrase subunit A
MNEFAKEVLPVNIEDELKHSYLDYAMSVIVSRALPDIRDGLKPVHRRVLYAMHVLNNDWNKAYKKSARIVGDVIGKYHPHGDVAVYHTIVRMAQPFSMRYMLVDGQGNFGSIDGDSPAAMRYTEVRMSRMAHFLLADLEKNTVDFAPNYDGTETMPSVLPSQIPNLLVNGAAGIAVGMATNIPPHNLSEVVDACIALIKNPEIQLEELMQHIKGPDFPTAGIINGRAGIVRAYRTGRGRIYVRAKSHIEEKEKTDKKAIIVTELPYQVNKARLLEKIADLVKDKKIEGISALRDESDKDGMRMVIELRRGEIPDVVLNNLYAHTALQSVFGINIVALKEGQPQVFNLKQTLEAFVEHRRDVVTRRTVYELEKAQARSHILEGLSIALENIDEVIALIKAAKTPAIAKKQLLEKIWQTGAIANLLEKKINEYKLSITQAQASLDLRLHRLTGLEQEKIINEYKEILKSIADLKDILSKPERVMQIIHQELLEVKKQFGDARRTEIVETKQDLTTEDLITEEDVVVTLSHEGYVKTQSLDLYQAQHRGGRGKTATSVKAEDFVEHLLIANTHDNILCFSNNGKVYWLKVYQIPQATRQSRGRPIINLLPLEKGERINAILPVKEYVEDKFIFMATENGTVKKTSLKHFSRPRANGIIALALADGDRLVGVDITNGKRDIMLFSDSGKAIRFAESAVRPMGRTARGVRGIKLKPDQKVISLVIVRDGGAILTATENGYGKRTDIEEYNRIGRGGQGVISIQVSNRNGKVIGAIQVIDTDEIMLISNRGTLVRTRIDEISMIGRNTQGVRLINVARDEKLIGIAKVAE